MSKPHLALMVQVLRFFPRDDDDADDFSVRQASHRLRPWVNKLLQLGTADIQGLRINAGIVSCPKVLSQLPLCFLELEIEQSFKGDLKEIMEALGQCHYHDDAPPWNIYLLSSMRNPSQAIHVWGSCQTYVCARLQI